MRTKKWMPQGFYDRLDAVMSDHNNHWWSDRLGINRKTVSAYRNAVSIPQVDVFMKICEETKTSPEYILFGRESK